MNYLKLLIVWKDIIIANIWNFDCLLLCLKVKNYLCRLNLDQVWLVYCDVDLDILSFLRKRLFKFYEVKIWELTFDKHELLLREHDLAFVKVFNYNFFPKNLLDGLNTYLSLRAWSYCLFKWAFLFVFYIFDY
jgi:hypothetical protein